MCGQGQPTIQLVDHVEAGQVMILLRILVGKLHEAWEFFRKRVLSNSALSRKYLPVLEQEATTAIDDLKKHFRRGGPLTRIRNKFSFHYEDEDDLIEASFQRLPPDEVWEFYFSKTVGNSFYYASELVVTSGVLTLMDENAGGDTNARFARLCGLTIDVSRQM